MQKLSTRSSIRHQGNKIQCSGLLLAGRVFLRWTTPRIQILAEVLAKVLAMVMARVVARGCKMLACLPGSLRSNWLVLMQLVKLRGQSNNRSPRLQPDGVPGARWWKPRPTRGTRRRGTCGGRGCSRGSRSGRRGPKIWSVAKK